jgi:hypothetical protein
LGLRPGVASGRGLSLRPVEDAVARADRYFLTYFRKTCEREGRKRHHDVSDRHVVEPRGDQVCGDPQQPGARDVRADSRPTGQDGQAHGELDHAHDPQERTGGDRQELGGERAHVGAPIREEIEEFVDAGQRRGHADAIPQPEPRSVQSIVH